MTALTLTPAAPRAKRMLLAFAPLVLLVGAAIVTNLGGGIASDAHAANSVTVTSTLGSDIHITSTCGTAGTDGTLAFGAVVAATTYDSACAIVFGSTQATANLQVNGSAANLGRHIPFCSSIAWDQSRAAPAQSPRFDAATAAGYMVVDSGTVIATHLNHLLGSHAAELLGPDEVQSLLDRLKESAAHLVASLSPSPVPLSALTQVLRALLAEGIPLKEFRRIAAAIANAAQRTLDPEELVEAIRPDLGPLIIQRLCGPREPLRVMTLEGQLEAILSQAVRSDPANRHMIEPDLGRRIIDALQTAARPLIAESKPFAVVVQPSVRVAVRKLVRASLPDTPVMSFLEVPEDKPVEVVAVIGAPQQLAA